MIFVFGCEKSPAGAAVVPTDTLKATPVHQAFPSTETRVLLCSVPQGETKVLKIKNLRPKDFSDYTCQVSVRNVCNIEDKSVTFRLTNATCMSPLLTQRERMTAWNASPCARMHGNFLALTFNTSLFCAVLSTPPPQALCEQAEGSFSPSLFLNNSTAVKEISVFSHPFLLPLSFGLFPAALLAFHSNALILASLSVESRRTLLSRCLVSLFGPRFHVSSNPAVALGYLWFTLHRPSMSLSPSNVNALRSILLRKKKERQHEKYRPKTSVGCS